MENIVLAVVPDACMNCFCWDRSLDQEAKARESQDKKDSKDEKMEELLRKVDADFLAMIKEAEDDESRAVESSTLEMSAEEKA
jgi:membrane protein involved in colicin uptake